MPCPGDVRADSTQEWFFFGSVDRGFGMCGRSADSSIVASFHALKTSGMLGWTTFTWMLISPTPATFIRRGERRTVLLLLCTVCPTSYIVSVTRLSALRKTVTSVHCVYSHQCMDWWSIYALNCCLSASNSFTVASFLDSICQFEICSSCNIFDKLGWSSPTTGQLQIICSQSGPCLQCSARKWRAVMNDSILFWVVATTG